MHKNNLVGGTFFDRHTIVTTSMTKGKVRINIDLDYIFPTTTYQPFTNIADATRYYQ